MKEIPEITKSPCCNEFSPIEYEASLGKAIINQTELNLHFKLKPPSSKECSFVTKLKSEGKSIIYIEYEIINHVILKQEGNRNSIHQFQDFLKKVDLLLITFPYYSFTS